MKVRNASSICTTERFSCPFKGIKPCSPFACLLLRHTLSCQTKWCMLNACIYTDSKHEVTIYVNVQGNMRFSVHAYTFMCEGCHVIDLSPSKAALVACAHHSSAPTARHVVVLSTQTHRRYFALMVLACVLQGAGVLSSVVSAAIRMCVSY
jgi:hypothetical protein